MECQLLPGGQEVLAVPFSSAPLIAVPVLSHKPQTMVLEDCF